MIVGDIVKVRGSLGGSLEGREGEVVRFRADGVAMVQFDPAFFAVPLRFEQSSLIIVRPVVPVSKGVRVKVLRRKFGTPGAEGVVIKEVLYDVAYVLLDGDTDAIPFAVDNLEVIAPVEEKAPGICVGDRVTPASRGSKFWGKKGTVVSIDKGIASVWFEGGEYDTAKAFFLDSLTKISWEPEVPLFVTAPIARTAAVAEVAAVAPVAKCCHEVPSSSVSSFSDMQMRLARSCARGVRQLGFVNELLMDEGVRSTYSIGHQTYVHYGDSRLGGKSWVALKKRLVAMGFVVKVDQEKNKVSMRFSG